MEKKALELAKKYHSKKRRRDGSNYVIHPIRVAKNVSQLTSDKEVISAAYLHDTIEESIENLELLKKLKKEIHELSPKVLEYVEMLTHEKNKDNYESYIKKISENKKILLIKMCDIMDNLSDNPSENQKKKYQKALTILISKL